MWKILIVILICLIFLAIYMSYSSKKEKNDYLIKIKSRFGQVPQREYTYEEFQSISEYAREKKEESFFIDDITWKDLDMDRIYILLNQTMTFCGEEYLYDMLRRPLFNKEELEKRNHLIEFFSTHEKERVEILSQIAVAGKSQFFSMYHYIKRTFESDYQPSMIHSIQAIVGLLTILFCFIEPAAGVPLCFLVVGYNFITYFKEKGDIDPYLKGFQGVLGMINAAEQISKNPNGIIKEQVETIRKASESLNKFKKGSYLVTKRGIATENIVDGILEYVKMFFHIDLIKFHSMLSELKKHQDQVMILKDTIGFLDSMAAIASFREILPYYSIPKLEQSQHAYIKVEKLYHPLIDEPVANSIDTSQSVLITGSNASGKSTFLKNVAINSILAQTIFTSVSSSYEASYLKTLTSMALQDDLDSGESYYIVEIKSLKRILDASLDYVPMLCIVDEVLRGTNTIERISASSRILQHLAKPHVLSFAATHDIELTYILENYYDNYHFAESIVEGNILFNYLLQDGRATTRNAIKLLDVMGYEKEVVEAAISASKSFEKSGIWDVLQ